MYSLDFLKAQDKTELQRIALADFGKELKPAMTQASMVETLIELQGGESNDLLSPASPADVAPEVLETGAEGDDEPRYAVTVFEEKGESPYVDLAVNGRALRIRRGSEVVIAERFVNLLRNSMQIVHEPVQKDGKTSMSEKPVPRFNFTAVPVSSADQ